MAEAQLAAWESIGYDILFPDADNYYLVEPFGCQLAFYDDSVPALVRPALTRLEEVFDLEVPDPWRDGRMPVYLEATHRIAEVVGDEAVIRVPGTGPFAVASYLIGMQAFLTEIALIEHDLDKTHNAAIERMLELATETVIRFGLAQLEAGAHILQCGDSLASGGVVSPKTYRRFILPWHQKIFENWKQAGAITVLHVCGDNHRSLELLAETGAHIVAIDSLVDLHLAKKTIGDHVTLIGNIDPVGVMYHGDYETAHRAAEACISAAAKGGGYILGTGCEIPPGSPADNVRALVNAAHNWHGDVRIEEKYDG
jgi:uroporphyrinogen decarboxylase